MRTTLDIADDVLFAAKEIARREKKSVGQIISDLARQSFTRSAATEVSASPGSAVVLHASERLATYGINPLPRRGTIVSNELIDRLRDQEGV
jgi:RNA 3'-terminal phosphate cyclase